MVRIRLRPREWAKFQHFKWRRPPWIKLRRALLEQPQWHWLPDASKALAPMLWLLASDREQGLIDDTLEHLAFRLRWQEGKLADALRPLVEQGFFEEDATGVETGDGAAGPRLPGHCRPSPEDRHFALRHGMNPKGVAHALRDDRQAVSGGNGRTTDGSAIWRDWVQRHAIELRAAAVTSNDENR